jgi:hypothetical protein
MDAFHLLYEAVQKLDGAVDQYSNERSAQHHA